MRLLITVLSLLFTFVASANEQVWTTVDEVHPLWQALNTKAVDMSSDLIDVQRKEVGGIRCDKISPNSENPFFPPQVQYHCNLPETLTASQVLAIFNDLINEALPTSGAYTELKVVDKLLIVADTDSNPAQVNQSRLFYNHPCYIINSKSEASACMTFWSTDVLPSFEAANESEVVLATQKVKTFAKKVVAWDSNSAASIDRVEESNYIGMMVESQDETHFYYFSLIKGTNIAPKEIMNFNLVDFEYTEVGDMAKTATETELLQLINDVTEAFFLGDSNRFPFVREHIEESLTYLNEEN